MADISGLCVLCQREATVESTGCRHQFCGPCSAIVYKCPKCDAPVSDFSPLTLAPKPADSGKAPELQMRDFTGLYGAANTDIDIVVNQKDKYKCHKVVLQESSRVLRDLAQTTPVIVLLLPDPTAFSLMLRFMYTSVLPAHLDNSNLISLAKLANELGVDSLAVLVEQRIETKFHSPAASNTDELFELSIGIINILHTFSNEASALAVINFVAENVSTLLRQHEAVTLNEKTLEAILSSPRLRVGTHRQLERYLQTWVANNTHSLPILAFKNNPEWLASVKTDPFGLAASVVCFFADGTDRYTQMTITAIETFLDKTPALFVGIIVPHNDNATRVKVENSIAAVHKHRVIYRYANPVPYFQNWNPTQYKMDIAQFTQEHLGFENVFWMDSDTVTTGNLSSFFSRFTSQSEKLFYFTPDHVMHDPVFMQRWKDLFQTEVMVPQACVMGFKASVIPAYFDQWKSYWRQFIEPTPFAQLPDPRPHFEGSAFCTEQYAMGLALNHNNWAALVMTFDRRLVLVPSKFAEGQRNNLVTLEIQGASGDTSTVPLISAITETTLSNALVSLSISSVRISISSSLPLGFKLQPGDVVVDMFGGALVHAYNQQYAQVLRWYYTQATGK